MTWDILFMIDNAQNNCGKIHCSQISDALLVSAQHLGLNRSILDNLNVFPVPDGDTGTNMVGTYVPAIQLLEKEHITSPRQIAEIILPYMNNNSRGNSGFILSRFFKGFFSKENNSEFLTTQDLAEGFSNGFYEVNSSLFNPIAGTMVTIIEAMKEVMQSSLDLVFINSLDLAVTKAIEVLFDTPKMLPILAKAGVIDSGALGFILIIEGILLGLTGNIPQRKEESTYRFDPDPSAIDKNAEGEQKNQFCTELTLHKTKSTDSFDIREYLQSMGDSIALVNTEEILKLHIHTNHPELIVKTLELYGEIRRKKIDDMFEQVSEKVKNEVFSEECSVVMFSPGSGFSQIFEELGIKHIISYSNILPSIGEITDVIQHIAESHLIILPNNNNILLSCMAAGDQIDKDISIIPTANVVQGLTCFYGYSENEHVETNVINMKECQNLASTLFLFKSSNMRTFGGSVLHKDDYFGLSDNSIYAVDPDFQTALIESLAHFSMEDFCNITLFYKNDAIQKKLEAVESEILKRFPQLEIELLFGGQHQAEVIISLE